MRKIAQFIPHLLMVLAVATVSLTSLFGTPGGFPGLVSSIPTAGLLLTLAAFIENQNKRAGDNAELKSKFYLDSALAAYSTARSLLEGGTLDRADWIASGRILAHARSFELLITSSAHRKVLELSAISRREFFASLLSAMPSQAFYGGDDNTTIDDAARRSSAPEVIHGRRVTSTTRYIDESSIASVWKAAQWPAEYEDPLQERFTDHRAQLYVLWPALYEYIEHRRNWMSEAGELRPIRRNP